MSIFGIVETVYNVHERGVYKGIFIFIISYGTRNLIQCLSPELYQKSYLCNILKQDFVMSLNCPGWTLTCHFLDSASQGSGITGLFTISG